MVFSASFRGNSSTAFLRKQHCFATKHSLSMLGQVRLWYEATGACRASFSSIEGFCNTTLRKSSGTVVLARQYCFSKQEALCAELSSDSGRCTHIMQRSTEIQAFRSHIPDSYFSQKRQSEKTSYFRKVQVIRTGDSRFGIRRTPEATRDVSTTDISLQNPDHCSHAGAQAFD